MTFSLQSSAFEHGSEIPRWSGAPGATKTFALIVFGTSSEPIGEGPADRSP